VTVSRPAFKPDDPLDLFRNLILIREVESTLARLFAAARIPGFIHLSVGQEAVAVGVGAALAPQDTIASTHRGHGHALMKGIDLTSFFAELLGSDAGLCRGRGGSMHVADISKGMLGANGIVGAGLPIAVGSALAHQVRDSDSVAVAFFGDGAMAEGAFYESLNLASMWRAPLLLVCENNGWGEFTPSDRQLATRLEDIAGAFSLPYRRLDGNDVAAVFEGASLALEELRRGEGPRVLECMTFRVRGHYEGDPQRYRPKEDSDDQAARDPIARCEARLREAGVAEADLAGARRSVSDEIAAALDAAESLHAAGGERELGSAYAGAV